MNVDKHRYGKQEPTRFPKITLHRPAQSAKMNRMVALTHPLLELKDGLNRRIIRDETGGSGDKIHYYYNENWQVLEERKEVGGTIDPDPLAQYVYHPHYIDAVAIRYYDSNTDNVGIRKDYYLYDANFNVTALIVGNGSVVERYHYSPYGEVTILNPNFDEDSNNTSDIGNEILFTGRRLDPETGLQLNRNRFYHAKLGRWINVDPILYDGGGYNLFEYVGSQPLIGLDPSGEKWDCIICACCAGATGISCGVLCATGHWDVPGESFGSCFWKCLKAVPGASKTFDFACLTACSSCAGRGRVSICPPALRRKLQTGVTKACKRKRACKGFMTCPMLKAYKKINQACAFARDAVNKGCYLGGNKGHQRAANEARAAAKKCQRFLDRKGCS